MGKMSRFQTALAVFTTNEYFRSQQRWRHQKPNDNSQGFNDQDWGNITENPNSNSQNVANPDSNLETDAIFQQSE